MRLIDADKVFEFMKSKIDMQDVYLPIHFMDMVIDEMPTAYDVDKVVEELEEEKQRLRWLKNDTIALSDSEVIAIEEKAYDFAIDIVKRGGVE